MRKIITERLIMRPFDAADINYLIHLKGSPTNMAGTTVGPIDATQATIQLDHYRQQWKDLGLGMWSLTHKASGEFVGECGYVKRPDLDDFSLRYTLSDNWWGQGLTPEAVQATLRTMKEKRGEAGIGQGTQACVKIKETVAICI